MVYYTQLKETGRVKIYKGRVKGLSVDKIAQETGRHKSTIYRELSRNSDEIGYLYPRDAHEQTKKRKSGSAILHRISIHHRPLEIENHEKFGHFEADLMFNKGSQSVNTLTIIERKSRMVFLVKHNSKQSAPIIKSIEKKIGNVALSCTFDNGTEF